MKTVIAAFLVSALFLSAPARADTPDPVVVGVDPLLWESTLAGASGWEEAGAVDFDFVEGCGAGAINVCVTWWEPGWHVAWWDVTTGTIYVDGYDQAVWTPAFACHEFGHLLGLAYHRTDYLSCMSDPDPTVAVPDDIDLTNLGIEMGPPNDGTGGPNP